MSVDIQSNQGNRLCRVSLEEWDWLLRPSLSGFTQPKLDSAASLTVFIEDPLGFHNTVASGAY